jgi:hypothetical protein
VTGVTGAAGYRIEYSRFVGAHAGETFRTRFLGLAVLYAELRALRAAGGEHAAPWCKVDRPEGYDMTGVVELYEHVSWSPAKPERIALVRVGP